MHYNEDSGWEFQIRKRNGDARWNLTLPNLLSHHSDMINNKVILPGWLNSVRQIVATARYVHAKNLNNQNAPGTLKLALLIINPDRPIWLASYIEELHGLLRMETFTVITKQQYITLMKKHGVTVIPTYCVLTVKVDGLGNPVRA